MSSKYDGPFRRLQVSLDPALSFTCAIANPAPGMKLNCQRCVLEHTQIRSASMSRKVLLICGILSSLLYVGTDIIGGLSYEGYDFASQYISELGAIGAPSRSLVVPLYLMHDVLVIAFASGVWVAASRKPVLRFTGGLLAGYAVVGLVGVLFFPMHPIGAEATLTDTIHQIIAAVTVLFILLMIGFAATAFGKQFRLYSIGTVLMYLVLGILPFLGVAQVEAGQPTPWVGLVERIMVYGYMLWAAVLAIVLWRVEKSQAQLTAAMPN